MKNLPIGQLLLEQGYITEEQLNSALAHQKAHPGNRLGDVLIELGYITEEKKLKALSVRLNVPVYEGFQINVNSDIVRLISESRTTRCSWPPAIRLTSTHWKISKLPAESRYLRF